MSAQAANHKERCHDSEWLPRPMFVGPTEQELVRLAKLGDREAYAELYRRHSKMIYHVVFRMTGNREDTEDVLQDAAIKAFLHMNGFREQSAFSSWLTRIAINGVLMLRRKQNCRRAISTDASTGMGELQLPDTAANAEMRMQETERVNKIHQAIRRLPIILRVPLQLQISEELSVRDLAKRLGITVAATKTRLFRARNIVGRLLAIGTDEQRTTRSRSEEQFNYARSLDRRMRESRQRVRRRLPNRAASTE